MRTQVSRDAFAPCHQRPAGESSRSVNRSRYKLLTFFIAVLTGIAVSELFFPAAGSTVALLIAAGVAALVATLMAWLGSQR